MKLVDYVKKNYTRLERRDFRFAYLIVLFPVVQFLIFWFYVNVSSIGFAFQNNLGEFTLQNFKTVYNAFIDKDMLGINLGKSLGRSFLLWIIGEGIIFPITLITTYVLTKKIMGHYIFRVIYYVPGLMGAIIWTLLIKEMVGYSGPITKLLMSLNVELPGGVRKNGLLRHEDTAFVTLIMVRSVMGIVGNNAVLTGAYTRVPDELFESAELDGAGFFTQMFRIPLIFSAPELHLPCWHQQDAPQATYLRYRSPYNTRSEIYPSVFHIRGAGFPRDLRRNNEKHRQRTICLRCLPRCHVRRLALSSKRLLSHR